jgi:hypothetical protein
MVFEPESAPNSRDEFLEWYAAQTQWKEDHSYNDPIVSSARLQSWLADMFSSYPPMNGPSAPPELPDDESMLADYSIGEQIVYVGFAWSKAQAAFEDVFRLAAKHHLGLFNASSEDSEIWLPRAGQLALAPRKFR